MNLENEDLYFHPFIACCNCLEIVNKWKWVTNPNDDFKDIYGVCYRCEFKVATKGL
jgi:hypothetical protein